MSTLYLVLRADRTMMSTDIFGVEHKCNLPQGQYAIPAFDTREAAEEHADGRFGIMEMSGSHNDKEEKPYKP